MLAALAIALTGCLSIKSQGLMQPRAPGVVTIGGVVCGSDYNAESYNDCQPSNIAEQDNRGNDFRSCDADHSANDPGLCGRSDNGQLLVGFRVPIGSDGPDSFATDVRDLHLEKSPSYTDQLQASSPAPPGSHWVGYVSDVRFFQTGPLADNPTGIHPEFTLPPQPNGAPFPGPFHWRWVVGFRGVDPSQAGSPVDCTSIVTFCIDSPRSNQVSNDLPAENVSDFGVLGGSSASVGQGTTAVVSFPLQYRDARAIGAQNFSITAATTVPGASAKPSVTTVHALANSTNSVSVSVPVPAATPLGNYTVTLTASAGNPAVVRSNRASISVVDRLAPSIRISTPAQGAKLVRGQRVTADYGCTDQLNASGLRNCTGPAANGARIDTGSVGRKTFRVNASDKAGNAATLVHTYNVKPSPPPDIGVTFFFTPPAQTTTFTSLVAKRIPRGSTVTAICHPKGKRCPVRQFSKKRARGSVKVKPFLKKRFGAGATIEVRVTKPGTNGAVRLLSIRKNKAPALATRCLPLGAKKARKKC